MKKIIMTIGVAILSLIAMPGMVWATRSAIDEENNGGGNTTVSTNSTTDIVTGSCQGTTFLFMRPWYAALNCDSNNNIIDEQFNSDNLGETIGKILAVVIDDILRIIGIIAAGFIIYGGFQYASSSGDTAKAAKARKTLTSAIVGLVIVIVSQMVIKTFETLIFKDETYKEVSITGVISGTLNIYTINPETLMETAVNFVLSGMALVSIGFLIYSGIIMMTSYGDASKTAKGRKGVLYSVVGIAVSLLAFAIVNFVLGGLKTAMPNGADTDLFAMIVSIFGWVVGIAGFVAVVGVIIGGVYYMTSAGDPARVAKGKNTVIYSVIGLLVTIVAGSAIAFILNAAFV